MPLEHRRRANRATGEVAATVGAPPAEPVLDAFGAERALVRADPCELTVRGEVAVAALAVRSEFEHHPNLDECRWVYAPTTDRVVLVV
jgi:uncharacterized membrane protein